MKISCSFALLTVKNKIAVGAAVGAAVGEAVGATAVAAASEKKFSL